ncbi:anti-sigma factor [Halomicronema sp. CCY15110]|uniref:anti-sigma factor n=1 Tax=Halomicronema sp. CCY15110 TaxID=2767773 RepID=UPI00194E50ED|nr:anti-sigma factor [Halomicronema sp. CCY15110]
MAESISAEALQELIAGYVLYDLSPEEAATLQQLMAQDATIAPAIERLQTLLEAAHTSAAVPPPDRVRAAVLNAHQALSPVAEPATAGSVVPLVPPRSSPRRRWRGWGAVAAAIIVGLGVSNVVLWRSLQMARNPLGSGDALIVTLTPIASDTPSASAIVTINAESLQATLDIGQLPPLEVGQVYALWTVLQPNAPFTTDDKDAILTEVVTADDLGRPAVQIPLPPVYRDREWIKAIAVTVEAADAPQRHVSSPILFTAL